MLKLLAAGVGLLCVVAFPIEGAPVLSAMPTECAGCDRDLDSYQGSPKVAQFTQEPTLVDGSCDEVVSACSGTPCSYIGNLSIANISQGALWVEHDGSTYTINPGESWTVTFPATDIACGDDLYIPIYDAPPGPGRLEVAYYWMSCSSCD